MQRTPSAKLSEIERAWHLIDAEGKTLGRMASRIARILQGKHRPIYTPHVDTGDYVIVVNAAKVHLTGKKREQKVYRRYTGWVGGLKETPVKTMLANKPEDVVRLAVRRMMPKTKMGKQMLTKLKVYAGPEHPHAAQKPATLDIEEFRG